MEYQICCQMQQLYGINKAIFYANMTLIINKLVDDFHHISS